MCIPFKKWLVVKVLVFFMASISLPGLSASVKIHIEHADLIQQGSLIQGQVEDGAQLYFEDKPVFTDSSGRFVLGLGRDYAQTLTLITVKGEQRAEHSYPVQQRVYDVQSIEGVEQKYVSPPESVVERIREDNESVKRARAQFSDTPFFKNGFIMPAKGRISGVYGSQRVFNGVPKRPHYGLDVAAPIGTPVIAPADGVVTLVDDLYYSGGTIIVDHGWGISSTFIHLHTMHVNVGDNVVQGQKIAEIGATGRVTGPHLDWRINWFNQRLDPALVLPE